MKILLTSDLHLGMKFAGYPELQARLSAARFTCLERIVALANERRCDLLVIAGDLFQTPQMTRRDIQRAGEAIRELQGRLTAVLPGNHDYIGAGDELWPRFREAAGDGALILEKKEPYPLAHYGIDACLYPGPCESRHSEQNAVGWVRNAPRDASVSWHIGIAHGSLQGVSPDFEDNYYPMTFTELEQCALDLWLIGHTHNPYPVNPGVTDRFFCAGTPEPDGFDCAHEGTVTVLDLGEHVNAEAVPAGSYRFLRETAEISSASELSALERRWAVPEAERTLLRVSLRGTVPPEDLEGVEQVRRRLGEKLAWLGWDADALKKMIDEKTIDREFPAGSFPHSLLKALARNGDSEGLQLAYELLQEARG